MSSTAYRDGLLRRLQDPEFLVEYYVAAAQSNDETVLLMAVRDILETGMYQPVQLLKLRACSDAVVPAGNPDEYLLGEANVGSLPVAYRLTGILTASPALGACVRILRWSRNGVVIPGVFTSTEVTQIGSGEFQTANSVYRLTFAIRGEKSFGDPESWRFE
ncbi:MAG TPA: hypothetical protein VL970_15485 [Candidatus Acidoferrales bacterium]|nr:hypothetical protein [Candidatus Acidoferrales bacterium]